MRMNRIVTIALAAIPLAAYPRTVSTGSAECRPGVTIAIPVIVDDIVGASGVMIAVNTDSAVLKGAGVSAGGLADEASIVAADDGSGHVCVVIPKLKASSGGGELCRIRYRVREGTLDLYSDVALASVQFCAADGVTDLSVENPITISNGMVRVTADGADGDAGEEEVEVKADGGDLPQETAEKILDMVADDLSAHPEVKSVAVRGDVSIVPITANLGIAPRIDVLGTEATATYVKPSITITAFDSSTGVVRIRVDPGEGNSIRTTPATGCIHVYGTSNLGEKMRYIGNVEVDVSPYLAAETAGEAELTVDLGDYMFFKVKAETVIKGDGEVE